MIVGIETLILIMIASRIVSIVSRIVKMPTADLLW